MVRRRTNPNSPRNLERRMKKNAGQLALRNTPYISEAYKQYQNYQNLNAIKRDGVRYLRYKIARTRRRYRAYI
jgi:hypothetical protein